MVGYALTFGLKLKGPNQIVQTKLYKQPKMAFKLLVMGRWRNLKVIIFRCIFNTAQNQKNSFKALDFLAIKNIQ